MKNIIIWMVFMCAIMSSCNNDYFEHIDMCEQNKDIKNSSLLCEMSSFNDSLLNTKTLTRLSYRNRLNYLSIVCADAMGAYSGGCTGAKMGSVIGHPHVGAAIGAVICGGFSSYKCYDLLYHKRVSSDVGLIDGTIRNPLLDGGTELLSRKDLSVTRAFVESDRLEPMEVAAAYVPSLLNESSIEENLPKQIKLDLNQGDMGYSEVGAKHNIIVRNLKTKNFVLDSDVKKYLSKEEIYVLESPEFIHEYDSIVLSLEKSIIKGEIPHNSNHDIPSLLMNMFTNVLEEYPCDAYDVEFIINKYLDAVQKTPELTLEEKDNIYNALSVAASSFELWD